jgi:hypothetical protein
MKVALKRLNGSQNMSSEINLIYLKNTLKLHIGCMKSILSSNFSDLYLLL